MNRTIATVISLTLMLAVDVAAQVQSSALEERLRESVLTAPTPTYPAAVLARKISGVAVASVLIDTSGRPQTVIVLEAPDPLMAESVREAVLRWTFRPATSGRSPTDQQPATVASKLTFYFRVQNGAGVVLNPSEMPGARRPPAPPTAPTASVARGAGGPAVSSASTQDLSALEIDKMEFERRVASGTTTVLDTRDRDAFRRGHREGALNIPRDELVVRAPVEIPANNAVVVDCSQADDFTCRVGALRSIQLGFSVSVFKK